MDRAGLPASGILRLDLPARCAARSVDRRGRSPCSGCLGSPSGAGTDAGARRLEASTEVVVLARRGGTGLPRCEADARYGGATAVEFHHTFPLGRRLGRLPRRRASSDFRGGMRRGGHPNRGRRYTARPKPSTTTGGAALSWRRIARSPLTPAPSTNYISSSRAGATTMRRGWFATAPQLVTTSKNAPSPSAPRSTAARSSGADPS